MVAFDGRLLEGAIHPFNLAVGPGMFVLGETVFNGQFAAGTIKEVLKGLFVLFPVGELNAVVGQYGMNSVGQRLGKLAQELCSLHFSGFFMQFDVGELAGAVNRRKQIEPTLCGLYFGDIDVEIADRVAFEFFLTGLSASNSGKREIPWRCRQRCSEERLRCGSVGWSAYKQSSSGSRLCRRKATMIASSSAESTVERGCWGPAGRSLTDGRFRRWATVFGLTP
jgi:hypothetical protein